MEEQVMLKLDNFEQRLMVSSLNDRRNMLIRKQVSTEDLDNLMLKVIDAPPVKTKRREAREER